MVTKIIEIGSLNGIADAERHRLNPKTLAISAETICVRMWVLCEADSVRDPVTTVAFSTLAQKAVEKTYP